jgi:toxin FitB
VVTVAELERGVELLPTGTRRDRLATWLSSDLLARFDGRIVDIDVEVAREWGRLTARAQRVGRPMGVIDAFFAATARVFDLVLVTRNDSDFSEAAIEIFNPWKA